MSGTPPGFVETDVINGLHAAMEFGTYIDPATAATFYVPVPPLVAATATTDSSGVPFDINTDMTRQTTTPVQVLCAMEVTDKVPPGTNDTEPLGVINRTGLILTLLEAEYRQIEGFSHVEINGNTYTYSFTRPPIALGSVGVWQVIVTAQDEA